MEELAEIDYGLLFALDDGLQAVDLFLKCL